MKALIVDGNSHDARTSANCLAALGLACVIARNGEEGLRRLLTDEFCLAVTDTDLKGISGIELIRRARAAHDKTPILILSAQSQIGDRVCGLDIGADDYLTKPFSPSELQARANAILRRINMEMHRNRLTFRDLVLNIAERTAFRGSRQLELTPREYAILEYLLRNANRTVSVSMILQEVWNCATRPTTTMVETRLCILRKKLCQDGEDEIIHTLRGFGYVLK